MTARRNVAEHLLDTLRRRGMTYAFGVHGANIEDMYAAAARVGIPTVVAKHEFAAGAMADGLARMSGSSTLVLTTSGGGAMNVVPALAESFDSRVPVLAVIGTPPTPLVTRGGFQDMLDPPDTIDLVGVLRAITGHVEVVTDATGLSSALKSVFAVLERDLPCALIIPKDVQSQQIPGDDCVDHEIPPDRADHAVQSMLTTAADRLVDAARSGEPICLWIGEEASRERMGTTLHRMASRLSATVVAAPGGADAVNPLTGHAGITGVMGHPSARTALAAASICVAVGCRMTLTDRGGLDDELDHLEIVHIGRHSPRPPRGTTILVDSLADAVRYLDDTLADAGLVPRTLPDVETTYLEPPARRNVALPSLREIVDTISDVIPSGARIFADAGNVGAAAIHYLTPVADQRFTVALGMGGMGYAIAAGIGVAVGLAERSVIIAGDGAFFMHGMEFHTAVEHDAPVTLVILNNDAHGMCVTRESLYFPDTMGVNRFRPTDIAGGIAAMFAGLDVRHPCQLTELRADCAELFSGTGPNAIVVDCDPDEVPPFLPFLAKGSPPT